MFKEKRERAEKKKIDKFLEPFIEQIKSELPDGEQLKKFLRADFLSDLGSMGVGLKIDVTFTTPLDRPKLLKYIARQNRIRRNMTKLTKSDLRYLQSIGVKDAPEEQPAAVSPSS